jgi:small conductance mechanosensitive channel
MELLPDFQSYLQQFYQFIPRLAAGLVVFLVTIILSRWISSLVSRAMKRSNQDLEITKLIQQITRWGILAVGTMLALDQISDNITSLIAGLGITGFALGFALQDVAKNFIAGLLLLIQQPFDIGDAIEVGDYGGTVKDITLRVTELTTWDGRNVQIPNADVYVLPIINFSRSRERRVTLKIPVLQGADLELASSSAAQAVKALPGLLPDKEPVTIFSGIRSAELQLELHLWIDTAEIGFFEAQDAAYKAVMQAFDRAGIDIPTAELVVQVENSSSK